MTDKRSIALINFGILAVTMLVVAGILVLGRAAPPEAPPALTPGQPSPQDFTANRNSSPRSSPPTRRRSWPP